MARQVLNLISQKCPEPVRLVAEMIYAQIHTAGILNLVHWNGRMGHEFYGSTEKGSQHTLASSDTLISNA